MANAYQQTFEIRTRGRGTTEITTEVGQRVRASGVVTGVAHVFVQHTSCSVMITENADPDVRVDLESLAGRWAPDADSAYRHDVEGTDDMAARAQRALGKFGERAGRERRTAAGDVARIYLWETPDREGCAPRRGHRHG